jgi:hypothetical protein
MAFEVELALERLIDRLDDLPQRLEQLGSGALGLALAAGRSSRMCSSSSRRSKSRPK